MVRVALPPGDGEEGDRMWSLHPELGNAVRTFGAALQRNATLPVRVREAARMRIALINGCVPCTETRVDEMEAYGLDEAFYAHIDDPDRRAFYGRQEALAISFSERFAAGTQSFDDAFWAEMADAFSNAEIVELATLCAKWLGLGRLNAVMEIAVSCPIRIPGNPS